MILRSSNFVGLALSDRSIACVELSVNGDRRAVRHMASFPLPDQLSAANAGATGQALASFLRQHRFSTSRAIVGVPARWLIAMEREVPPADREQMRAMLRLQADRLAVAESGEMVFDYAGEPDSSHGGKVLLVGIRRQQLERIEMLLDAAGITVTAVTPTSLALACVLEPSQNRPMLVVGRSGAEMVWQNDGTPRLLRHLAFPAGGGADTLSLGPLGAELRRTVTLIPTNGSGAARELLLWDGLGLSTQQVTDLSDRLGISVRNERGLSLLGIGPEIAAVPAVDASPDHYAPAAALALAGAQSRKLQLDFKHPRLTLPRKKRLDRRILWAIVLGVVVVGGIGSLYWMIGQRQTQLDGVNQELKGMKEKYDAAEMMLTRFNYGQTYVGARPPVLECLRAIDLALPDDQLWITSINLHDNPRETTKDAKGVTKTKGGDMKCVLAGKATDQKIIIALAGRLGNNRRLFSDVRLQFSEVVVSGGRNKEQSFTIQFNFVIPE
ncbi:MAG: hypothetical protein ACHQK9_18755 [Reyranellales bacterium]